MPLVNFFTHLTHTESNVDCVETFKKTHIDKQNKEDYIPRPLAAFFSSIGSLIFCASSSAVLNSVNALSGC